MSRGNLLPGKTSSTALQPKQYGVTAPLRLGLLPEMDVVCDRGHTAYWLIATTHFVYYQERCLYDYRE
jgi:hypothetical protein